MAALLEHTLEKATRKQTKAHNRRLVLKTIYDQGQISRAGIARATGLTRTTVSGVTTRLMGDGLVEEIGYGPSSGGKPPILLSVIDDARHLIGIDLASDEFRGAVVNLRGEIRHQVSLPLQGQKGHAALAVVYGLIEQLMGAADRPLLGIGIGTPGLMDPLNGNVRWAVNLEWQNLPLRDLLRLRHQLPVYVLNDSQAAALAEHAFGQRGDEENLVVVKLGHGVGAGIVIDGRLFFGDTFGAGEIGHVAVVKSGLRCRCGNRGCLETVASAQAIVQQAQAGARRKPESLLNELAGKPEEIDLDHVCQAVQAGDPVSRQIVQSLGCHLAVALANLISVLGIKRIVIAGSLSCLGQPLLEAIGADLEGRALDLVAREIELSLSGMGTSMVTLGASALVLKNELGLIAPRTNGNR
jgi:glucokinase-like ROK family protein